MVMKKQFFFTRAFVMVLAACIVFTGCTSTTLIQTTPPGANVTLNGLIAGTTPYRHSDTRIVGSTNTLDLALPGYETLHTSFSRDEDVDVGAIIGGFCFYVPFLWTMKYNPIHHYQLVPLKNNGPTIVSEPTHPSVRTKADKLAELKQFFDDKLITAEDYEKQKTRILEEDK